MPALLIATMAVVHYGLAFNARAHEQFAADYAYAQRLMGMIVDLQQERIAELDTAGTLTAHSSPQRFDALERFGAGASDGTLSLAHEYDLYGDAVIAYSAHPDRKLKENVRARFSALRDHLQRLQDAAFDRAIRVREEHDRNTGRLQRFVPSATVLSILVLFTLGSL
jgi:hypothetical protein